MSSSAYSTVLVGAKLNKQKSYKLEQVRNCKHSYNEKDLFCSTCGKPIFTERFVLVFDDDDLDSLYSGGKEEIQLFETYDDNDIYIGIKLSGLSQGFSCEKEVNLKNIDEYKEKIINFLKKYNLENEEIKIYHLLSIS